MDRRGLRQHAFPWLLLFLTSAVAGDQVVTITAAPAIGTAEPQYTSEDVFTSAVLNNTNFYRSEYNASALSWNATLEDFASSYLDGDTDCNFTHSGGPYGENLAIGYPNVTASIEAWANEREQYNYKDPGFSEQTGHFTQLVWKSTTTVGCGRKLCSGGWFLACEYWPRGNVIGEFGTEVGTQVSGNAGATFRPVSASLLVLLMIASWSII